MSKDPTWIPKPPVLYGSDKLEIFQPYDPETPANTTPLDSPSCPRSPSETSTSGSVTLPSLLPPTRPNHPDSTSAMAAATQSTSTSISDKSSLTPSSDKTPLQTILTSLFGNKQTDSTPADGSSTKTTVSGKKLHGPMVDPIVEQYGQKSKVKEIEEEENDFDRPYDPEEEYDPAVGYGVVALQNTGKKEADATTVSGFVEDDVAYDPEDETIFADIQSGVGAKPPVQTQISDSPSCSTPVSSQAVTPTPASTGMQTSSPNGPTQNLPTGTVVVSAATLTEQQRMLEELNKQIEEQKRQLKEQEEALRQQREAVGMFMAHFSVSDTLMSPPQKSLPLSQLSSLQGGKMQTDSRLLESTEKTSNLTETVDSSLVDSQTVKLEDATVIPHLINETDTVAEQDETEKNVKDSDRYSSAGEIEDSDVAYDPEDESLFNEIQEDVFRGETKETYDSSLSRIGRSGSHTDMPQNSYHSRKRRLSPKKRSNREKDRHRSPSRKSRRSPSHSQRRKERDRHRRSERERSRHRTKEHSERQGRHHKDRTARRHSRGHRRSPSSHRQKDLVSLSPKHHRRPTPTLPETSSPSLSLKTELVETPDEDCSGYSQELLQNAKLEILEQPTFEEPQNDSLIDHDDKATVSSTQVDKPSQQETLAESKIESTIPLREIDPPIRDSPQSPDPEPQFVKPSKTENSDVKTEKLRDSGTYASLPMPVNEFENKSLVTACQADLSNILWPTLGGPLSNVRNQAINIADKIHTSGPEMDPVAKYQGPGKIDLDIRNMGSDIKDLSHWGPQVYPQETGNRFSGAHMRVSSMQCISSSIAVPAPHMQGTGTVSPVVQSHGIKSPVQDMECSNMQSINPEIKVPGRNMRCSEQVIRGQMLVSAVTISHTEGFCLQNERRDQVMKGPVLNRPGLDRRCSGSKEPLSAMTHSSPATSRNQDVRCPPEGSLCPRTEEHTAHPENPNVRPCVMELGGATFLGGLQMENKVQDVGRVRGQNNKDERYDTLGTSSALRGECVRDLSPSTLFLGPERVQMQSRKDSSTVSEDRGHQRMDFLRHRRDADMSIEVCGREGNLNTCMGSDSTDSTVDRLSSAIADNRQGSQRGGAVPMTGHGTNAHFENSGSKLSCSGQDSSGPERYYIRHGQDMDCMGGSDVAGNQSDSNVGSRREIGEMGLNNRDADMQGRNIQGLQLDMRNEQMSPRDRVSIPNNTIRDWRGPGCGIIGPGVRGRRSQNTDRGPHMRDPDWSDPRSDIQENWRGSDLARGGPFNQDEWRVHQVNQRGPNIEDMGYDSRGSVPDMEVSMHGKRRPGDLDFMGKGLERRGSNMEVPMHDRRGPDLRRPEPKGRGQIIDRQGPDIERPGGPELVGPHFERVVQPMESPGPTRRGPTGPDVRGPLPDRRGSSMEVSGTYRQGPQCPDFSETLPEGRSLSLEGPRPTKRGPGDPDFRGPGPNGIVPEGLESRGPWPESKGLSMDGPGPEWRGPGGPGPHQRDLSTEGFEQDRRSFGDPDFRVPGPDRRIPSIGHLGPERSGPGDPDFRGPGRDWSGTPMGGPGPERRLPNISALGAERIGPRGPDFSGPESDKSGPGIRGVAPEMKEFGVPDFSRTGHEIRRHTMDSQEPNRRGPRDTDFHGQGPQREELVMDGPLSMYNRGQSGPDLRGPECDWRGPSVQSQELDRRGSGDQNASGLGPDKRGSFKRGMRSDFIGLGPDQPSLGSHTGGQEGPHFRGSDPESRFQNIEGLDGDRRGPHFMGFIPDILDSGMEYGGPSRRGPGGPNMRRPDLQHSGQNMEGPMSDRRGPGPERRPPEMEETDNSRGFPRRPQFRGPMSEKRLLEIGGRESDAADPHRGLQPEITGMAPDRKDLRGPDFENSGPDNNVPGPGRQEGGARFRELGPERRGQGMESPGLDWRRSGGPGTGIRQKDPNRHSQRHRRDQWEGANFEGSESIQGRPNTDGPGSDRTGQNFKGPGPMRRSIRGSGPAMRTLNQGDRWKRPDFKGSRPDRRVTNTEEQWSDERGCSFEAVENEIECSSNDWRYPGDRGSGDRGPMTMQERPNMQGRVTEEHWSGFKDPVRNDQDTIYQGPSGGASGNEWREPDREAAGPKRWGPGQFFRGFRQPDNRGQGHDRRGSGMRGPGLDMRDSNDMSNDCRQSDFRSNVRGTNREGPEAHSGGADLNSCPNRREFEMGRDKRGPESENMWLENRNSNNSGNDEWVPGDWGPRSEGQGIDMGNPGSNRQGFEGFRKEIRGPDTRRLVSEKTEIRGLAPEHSGIRHGPGRRETIPMGPGSDSRGCEPPPHFSHPHQVARFQGPSGSHSSGPQGPTHNSGGSPHLNFDNQQNQQAVKPQRHRGALLPTPTEGLIRLPNRNHPDSFIPNRKRIGHSMNRTWRRGRPVSRERDLVKGQRKEQERNHPGKICAPSGSEEMKKEVNVQDRVH